MYDRKGCSGFLQLVIIWEKEKRQTMISTTLSNKTRITQETGAKSEDSEGLEVSTVLNNRTY
jgi:hypothetical protein